MRPMPSWIDEVKLRGPVFLKWVFIKGVSMLRKITLFLFAISFGFIQGCSTLADAKAAKGSGTAVVYAASFDEVWNAIPGVLKELQLPMITDNKATGEVLAQQGVTMMSYGENVAIYVEKVGNEVKTRVEVISKKSMATNVFATNWETRIIEKLNQKFKKAS